MGSLTTEVMGKFDGRGDADKLVYTPIGGGATYQQTRNSCEQSRSLVKPAQIPFVQMTNVVDTRYMLSLLHFIFGCLPSAFPSRAEFCL